MISKALIESFLAQERIAVIGVSRNKRKFGNVIYQELKKKGYQAFPINPRATEIDGDKCYPDLQSLPQAIDGVVINVPPIQAEKVLENCAHLGIKKVWLQQGSESETAIQFCQAKAIDCIYGECILMFAEPVGILHKLHRWVWQIIGKLPK